MQKILMAGAGGALGFELLKLLKENFFIKALAKDHTEAEKLRPLADEICIGDATRPDDIEGVCKDVDLVFSAMGKNLSLFDDDPKSFFDIDYLANHHLLCDAIASGVKRFVYISVYGSTLFKGYAMADAHAKFERELQENSLSYTIIKPVGIFSGFNDMLMMARKGYLISVGKGNSKTNPIHHVDLAEVCAKYIAEGPNFVEVGGPMVYTRKQISALVEKVYNGKLVKLQFPKPLVNLGLPIIQLGNTGQYQKLSFFNKIITTDVIAPAYGTRILEDYFKAHENHS